jgi:hypothetical protein
MLWQAIIFVLMITRSSEGGGEIVDVVETDHINVRESCRQIVAGSYLKIYDSIVSDQQYRELLAKNLASLRREHAKTKSRFDAQAKAFAREEYNVEMAKKKSTTFAHLTNIEERISETTQLDLETNDRLKEQRRKQAAFLKMTAGVFEIATKKAYQEVSAKEASRAQGFPFRLEYRSKCSKYRPLCPLTEDQADVLLRIKIDGETPLPCKRYATFTNLKGRHGR